jgi:hypothetical protein
MKTGYRIRQPEVAQKEWLVTQQLLYRRNNPRIGYHPLGEMIPTTT